MRNVGWRLVVLSPAALAVAGCSPVADEVGVVDGGCGATSCRASCVADGLPGGYCDGRACVCDGPGADADADADAVDDGGGEADGAPCRVVPGEIDGPWVAACTETAPLGSFDPDVQWTWTGPDGDRYSIVTPLVANLTDDNDDGRVDLCDVPDVVVVAYDGNTSLANESGHIYVLDGATGGTHFRVEAPVNATTTPALGDIDADGLPEIVTSDTDGYVGHLVAFEHDGATKWTSAAGWADIYGSAIALADLDADGDVEIVAGNTVTDHEGARLWTAPQPAGFWSATTAADLDGDGLLEVVLGHAAYRHDGSAYYVNAAIGPGYPQVANLDGDAEPEVLVANMQGLSVLEHDGTTKYADRRPTCTGISPTSWIRPATIHNFDGDADAEIAHSCANLYAVYEADGAIVWQTPIRDFSGIAAGTAFDFLGDGTAEAMYADEYDMFVFDPAGAVLLQVPRRSQTLTEYPVVADIDNDRSAEILVVSNDDGVPPLQAIRDREDRWIPARRIWNQHTYHVTNVLEDGTIPRVEPPSWASLNTFRTQSQVENGGVCEPPFL